MDLLELFNALHAGQLELFRLNFNETILLPKVNEAEGSSNIDPSVFLTSASKSSQKPLRLG